MCLGIHIVYVGYVVTFCIVMFVDVRSYVELLAFV